MKSFNFIISLIIAILFLSVGVTVGTLSSTIKVNRVHRQWEASMDSLIINIKDNCSHAPGVVLFPNGEIMLIRYIDVPMTESDWDNDIRNPENRQYVLECAIHHGITPEKVTQAQFNSRYRPQAYKYSIVGD